MVDEPRFRAPRSAALERDAAFSRVSRVRGWTIAGAAALTGAGAALVAATAPGHTVRARTRTVASSATPRSAAAPAKLPPLASPTQLGLQGPGQAPGSSSSSDPGSEDHRRGPDPRPPAPARLDRPHPRRRRRRLPRPPPPRRPHRVAARSCRAAPDRSRDPSHEHGDPGDRVGRVPRVGEHRCRRRRSNQTALEPARDAVETVVEEFDLACSRFRDDSELSAVNAADGAVMRVGELLLDAVEAAIRAAHVTDGDVDPTVGEALIALGYDRDFASLPARAFRVARVPGWRTVELDRKGEPFGFRAV